MPQDPKKRQKALMKQQRKHKASASAAKHRPPGQVSASTQAIIRRARSFPLLGCWISPDWQDTQSGLVQILLARQQPSGEVAFGVYLIDVYCLGLKNTFCNAGCSSARYQQEIALLFQDDAPSACPPELAHQMIYRSIEYAAQFGFKPHKDFELSQCLLEPRGELKEPYRLTFGKDGKPLFIAGPRDNVPGILAHLEKTAGPGNYNYVVLF